MRKHEKLVFTMDALHENKVLIINHGLNVFRLRDRVTVKTDPRHIVRETSDGTFEMTIKSSVRSDSGLYTCRIINEYGTKQCEARLDVKGVLGALF